MHAVRRWVLVSALTVAAPAAALSQVQQAAAPAGTLNSNAAPAAVAEFRAAMEDYWMLSWRTGAEHTSKAVELDSTFGYARAWKAFYLAGPTQAAEIARATRDALNNSTAEAVLALAYREGNAGRAPNSRRLMQVAVEMLPNERAIAMTRANGLADTARINAFKAISERYPDYAGSRIWAANYLAPVGIVVSDQIKANGDEALKIAAEAVRLAPQASGSHSAMGQVLHALARDAEATQHLVAATKMAPVSWTAWDLLGDIYARDGKQTDVRMAMDSVVAYAPSLAIQSNARRIKALTYMSEGDAKRAMDDFGTLLKELEAINANGQMITTHLGMALIAAGMRDSAAAEAHLASARSLNAGAGIQADNSVIVFSLIGNAPAARTALADYIRINTATPAANPAAQQVRDENIHRQTGLVLYAEKKYAEALAELKQAGPNPYVTVGLIECFRAMKNNKEADATRKAFYARREYTSNSTATPIIRYREKK